MRSPALCLLILVGCSGTPPGADAGSDSGIDAGDDVIDAGPRCFGVPATLTQYTCVGMGEPGSARCTEPNFEAAVAANFRNDCDAGPGILGHLSVGECNPGLKAVRWVYGVPGDTYECFYPTDGGVAVGGINYGDRGVFVSGSVAVCPTEPPSMCRDGG